MQRFVAGSILIVLGLAADAQQIQRCEGPDGKVTYSNDACPSGTSPTRQLQKAPPATDEQVSSARKQLERDSAAAAVVAEKQQQRQTEAEIAQEQERRDRCTYLQAEINASRRLRNTLSTRRYYSLDDLDAMDKRVRSLAEQYRSGCGAQ